MAGDRDATGQGKIGRKAGRRSRGGSWIYFAVAAVAVSAFAVFWRAGTDARRSAGVVGGETTSAPDFRLTLYQGANVLGAEELDFSSVLSAGRPVVLNFWAGLCPPCRAEMPTFQKVYDEFGGRFLLLGLDIGPFVGLGSREDGQRLLQELGITYPAGTTFEEVTVAEYRVRGMPTTVFLSASGEIVDTHIGLLDERTLRQRVEALLQGSDGS